MKSGHVLGCACALSPACRATTLTDAPHRTAAGTCCLPRVARFVNWRLCGAVQEDHTATRRYFSERHLTNAHHGASCNQVRRQVKDGLISGACGIERERVEVTI